MNEPGKGAINTNPGGTPEPGPMRRVGLPISQEVSSWPDIATAIGADTALL